MGINATSVLIAISNPTHCQSRARKNRRCLSGFGKIAFQFARRFGAVIGYSLSYFMAIGYRIYRMSRRERTF